MAHKFYAAGSVPDDPALGDDLEVLLSVYDRYLEDGGGAPRLWCIYVGRGVVVQRTAIHLARDF